MPHRCQFLVRALFSIRRWPSTVFGPVSRIIHLGLRMCCRSDTRLTLEFSGASCCCKDVVLSDVGRLAISQKPSHHTHLPISLRSSEQVGSDSSCLVSSLKTWILQIGDPLPGNNWLSTCATALILGLETWVERLGVSQRFRRKNPARGSVCEHHKTPKAI